MKPDNDVKPDSDVEVDNDVEVEDEEFAEALKALAGEENWLVDVRKFLDELGTLGDARIHESVRYWKAGLGGIVRILEDPMGDHETLALEVLELFALGADQCLAFFEDVTRPPSSLRATAPSKVPHVHLASLEDRPVQHLRRLVSTVREVLRGEHDAIQRLPQELRSGEAAFAYLRSSLMCEDWSASASEREP